MLSNTRAVPIVFSVFVAYTFMALAAIAEELELTRRCAAKTPATAPAAANAAARASSAPCASTA
jgi:hypothetical protein